MISFSKQKQISGLILWLVLCYAVSALGAVASVQAKDFYAQLIQPEWAPPGWLFAPVWTLLYGMMAISAWLVWRKGGFVLQGTKLYLFLFQLVLNGWWSWLFFAWYQGRFAFIDICILWVSILLTMILFWRVQPLAGWLLLPYLLWVSFATCLNYAIWQLNPIILG